MAPKTAAKPLRHDSRINSTILGFKRAFKEDADDTMVKLFKITNFDCAMELLQYMSRSPDFMNIRGFRNEPKFPADIQSLGERIRGETDVAKYYNCWCIDTDSMDNRIPTAQILAAVVKVIESDVLQAYEVEGPIYPLVEFESRFKKEFPDKIPLMSKKVAESEFGEASATEYQVRVGPCLQWLLKDVKTNYPWNKKIGARYFSEMTLSYALVNGEVNVFKMPATPVTLDAMNLKGLASDADLVKRE